MILNEIVIVLGGNSGDIFSLSRIFPLKLIRGSGTE